MPASRHTPVQLSTLSLVVLAHFSLAGCGDDASQPDYSAPTPTSYEQCNVREPERDDPAMSGLRAHWQPTEHSYNEEASLFVCVPYPRQGGEVKVFFLEGVQVTPSTAPVDPAGTGIIRFAVRASEGASGRLYISYSDEGGGGAAPGPRVESDDDGWSMQLYD
jgi:hypothetical protein